MAVSGAPGIFHSLKDVYGDSSALMEQRINCINEQYKKKFGRLPSFYARAPGRVNLIGEHIDYSGYSVLPMALEQDILIAASTNDKGTLNITSTNSQFGDFNVNASKYNIDGKSWYHYVLCGHKGLVEHASLSSPVGMDMVVDGTIPKSAGLSSSSALVCCSTLATMHANKLQIDKYTLADICTKCERYIGTEGGGMDQSISFLAERGTAKFIEFNPLKATDVKLPEGACFVIANSLVEITKSETAGTHFNVRVAECRIAAKVLAATSKLDWRKYRKLGEVQQALKKTLPEMLSLVETNLHTNEYNRKELLSLFDVKDDEFVKECLGPSTAHVQSFKLYQRARHVYEEAHRVSVFKETADDNKEGALKALGDLMNQSHRSCSELYECSSVELDQLTEICRSAGAFGSRLTGAGWGGCTVSLVPSQQVEKFLHQVENEYYAKVPSRANQVKESLFATKPGSGAALLENL